eukprot:3020890-Rhodomonas_salina.3
MSGTEIARGGLRRNASHVGGGEGTVGRRQAGGESRRGSGGEAGGDWEEGGRGRGSGGAAGERGSAEGAGAGALLGSLPYRPMRCPVLNCGIGCAISLCAAWLCYLRAAWYTALYRGAIGRAMSAQHAESTDAARARHQEALQSFMLSSASTEGS